MKIGTVIGRVTMNHNVDGYKGGRFFLVLPCTGGQLLRGAMEPLPAGNSVIVYDDLGASLGDRIAYSEGGEAAAPFAGDVPVDAYNCMILDQVIYQPPTRD